MTLKNMCKNKIVFFIALFFLLTFKTAFASSNTDQAIDQLLQTAPHTTITDRIHYFSTALLNKPYIIEPLGEGAQGEFNQRPLYRLDGFDCQTFVETVMALSLAQNLADFKKILINIRYKNSEIIFNKRNHFPSADWLPNNAKQGFIKDITQQIAGNNNIATKTVYINKQQWYQHLTAERIKIPGLNATQLQAKLAQLHVLEQQANNTWVSVDYIPSQKLLSNKQLVARIPDGTIILIVNQIAPVKLLGTEINITHMGLAIWHNHQLYLRAASTKLHHVADIKLTHYLRNAPWIDGISIWQLQLPIKP